MIVYRHRRLDDNEIFYVGIGKTEKRAYSKYNRNKHWHRIVNKVGHKVEIITTCDTWSEACQIEQYLIKYYGRRDLGTGTLVNLTDGGEGTLGHTPWNKGVILREDQKRKDYTHSAETRRKISEAGKGRYVSDETKLKKSITAKERGIKPPINNKAVIDVSTNIVYISALEVSNLFNLNVQTLRKKLNGCLTNNTNFKYIQNE